MGLTRTNSERSTIVFATALNNVAGLQTSVFPLASFPSGGIGLPIQFIVTSISSFKRYLLGGNENFGCCSKMVEFANKLQEKEGLFIRETIEKAAAIRLRPIFMTIADMVLGAVPLLIATGASAVSRFNIVPVIATGMLLVQFTLLIVPTMCTPSPSLLKNISYYAKPIPSNNH